MLINTLLLCVLLAAAFLEYMAPEAQAAPNQNPLGENNEKKGTEIIRGWEMSLLLVRLCGQNIRVRKL